MTYKDNGVGIEGSHKSESFGMELINTVIQQIGGKLDQNSDDIWNTQIMISFEKERG